MSASDVDLSDVDLVEDDPDYKAEAKRPSERAARADTNTPQPEADRPGKEQEPQQAGAQLSAYELERAQRVEANKKVLCKGGGYAPHCSPCDTPLSPLHALSSLCSAWRSWCRCLLALRA